MHRAICDVSCDWPDMRLGQSEYHYAQAGRGDEASVPQRNQDKWSTRDVTAQHDKLSDGVSAAALAALNGDC